jgi:hypothetical protein
MKAATLKTKMLPHIESTALHLRNSQNITGSVSAIACAYKERARHQKLKAIDSNNKHYTFSTFSDRILNMLLNPCAEHIVHVKCTTIHSAWEPLPCTKGNRDAASVLLPANTLVEGDTELDLQSGKWYTDLIGCNRMGGIDRYINCLTTSNLPIPRLRSWPFTRLSTKVQYRNVGLPSPVS